MLVYFAIFALTLFALLLVANVIASSGHGQKVRASLERLDNYDHGSFRQAELAAPMGERLIGPSIRRLAVVGQMITPTGRVRRLQTRMEQAGRPWNLDLSGLLAVKALAMFSTLLIVVVAAGLGLLPVGWAIPVIQ